MEVVSVEVATATVNEWLDFKKIPDARKAALSGMIEVLVNAVSEGHLSLDEETKTWNHALIFPIENNDGVVTVRELKYKARINEFDKSNPKRVVKGTDFDSQMLVAKLALTKADVNVLKSLDESTDKQISDAIAIFFV
jgi:hypothetical protein